MRSSQAQKKGGVIPLPVARGLSDAALVERARAGDRAAEEAIYLRHASYVTALCSRLLRAPADVPDVVQDTFVAVFEQLAALRQPERLRPWIAGIAVHRVHRRFRRRRLVALLGLGSEPSDACFLAPQPGLSAEQRAELARLDRVLGQLDDQDRTCWLLRHAEGQSLAEVAELCGCSLATAKRRLARAHRTVQAHVQFEEAHDE